MLGRSDDWLAARAYPLRYDASQINDSEGGTDSFAAQLDVLWRVHIDGREPYEFSEVRRAPLWTRRGSRFGRRFFHLRMRASHGIVRELGVPCRVHPDKPHKIDIDWSRAYDEHGPAWDRLDAVKKGHAQRAQGPLGKLLAPIEYFGTPKPSATEQAQIDREVEALIASEQRVSPATQAVVDENEWVAAQARDARRLLEAGRKAGATVTALSPPRPGSVVYTVMLDVDGVGPVEHRQALNGQWAAQLKPGSRTDVMIDPADPGRLTLA